MANGRSRAVRLAPIFLAWMAFWLTVAFQPCCQAMPTASAMAAHHEDADCHHGDEQRRCPQLAIDAIDAKPADSIATVIGDLIAPSGANEYPALTLRPTHPQALEQPPPPLSLYLHTARLRI